MLHTLYFVEKVTAVSLCLRIEYCPSCQFSHFVAKMKDFFTFSSSLPKILYLCHTVCSVYLAY